MRFLVVVIGCAVNGQLRLATHHSASEVRALLRRGSREEPLAWPSSSIRGRQRQLDMTNRSVLYTGCCGLGHRTWRLLKTFVFAASRRMRLSVDWGPCAGVKNVYSELFEDTELVWAYSPGRLLCNGRLCDKRQYFDSIYNNEPPNEWYPPGSAKIKVVSQREWGLEVLSAPVAAYSVRFTEDLVSALKPQWRRDVEEFVRTSFGRRPVLGVHFRFGNGEKFGRRPHNTTVLVLKAAKAIEALQEAYGERFIVFVASDDPVAIDAISQGGRFDVVHRVQWRPPKGAGVVFSSWGNREIHVDDNDARKRAHHDMVRDTEGCVRRSADMLIDALLLGYADIQLFTVASTFTVLPHVMAFARGAPTCLFLHTNVATLPQDRNGLPLSCRALAASNSSGPRFDIDKITLLV